MPFHVPSRLKGIETFFLLKLNSFSYETFHVPSRLKGIETLLLECVAEQPLNDRFPCTFPFEGN